MSSAVWEITQFASSVELRLADRVGGVVYGTHGGSPRLLDLFALAEDCYQTFTPAGLVYRNQTAPPTNRRSQREQH